MAVEITRRSGLRGLIGLAAAPLGGCASWFPHEDVGTGELKGDVEVRWIAQDRFIYLKTGNPLSFKASFMSVPIVPDVMFTDGGSIPQVFWGIPGLSPWGLGPAYIIHDWIFEVHRCGRNAPPEVKAITFEQSAIILAEVGKELIRVGLIRDDMLDAIVWGVRTRYARSLWGRPGTPDECKPPHLLRRAAVGGQTVVKFTIPPRRR
jgi:hypothetical protein